MPKIRNYEVANYVTIWEKIGIHFGIMNPFTDLTLPFFLIEELTNAIGM